MIMHVKFRKVRASIGVHSLFVAVVLGVAVIRLVFGQDSDQVPGQWDVKLL